MLSLPRFGHVPARKMAAGKSAPPETATAFLSFSDREVGFFCGKQTSEDRAQNGKRYTVSRVLLRRRELTGCLGTLGEFCQKLGEFTLEQQIIG